MLAYEFEKWMEGAPNWVRQAASERDCKITYVNGPWRLHMKGSSGFLLDRGNSAPIVRAYGCINPVLECRILGQDADSGPTYAEVLGLPPAPDYDQLLVERLLKTHGWAVYDGPTQEFEIEYRERMLWCPLKIGAPEDRPAEPDYRVLVRPKRCTDKYGVFPVAAYLVSYNHRGSQTYVRLAQADRFVELFGQKVLGTTLGTLLNVHLEAIG